MLLTVECLQNQERNRKDPRIHLLQMFIALKIGRDLEEAIRLFENLTQDYG